MGDLLGSPRVAPPFCSSSISHDLVAPPSQRGVSFFFFFFQRHNGTSPSPIPCRGWVRGRRVPSSVLPVPYRCPWCAPGIKNEGPGSGTAESESAGGTKRARLFAPSISSSRAFRRYIIMSIPTDGSEVTAPARRSCPRPPPTWKTQGVSFASTLRVRSYQR